jgi:hypothetical protein
MFFDTPVLYQCLPMPKSNALIALSKCRKSGIIGKTFIPIVISGTMVSVTYFRVQSTPLMSHHEGEKRRIVRETANSPLLCPCGEVFKCGRKAKEHALRAHSGQQGGCVANGDVRGYKSWNLESRRQCEIIA